MSLSAASPGTSRAVGPSWRSSAVKRAHGGASRHTLHESALTTQTSMRQGSPLPHLLKRRRARLAQHAGEASRGPFERTKPSKGTGPEDRQTRAAWRPDNATNGHTHSPQGRDVHQHQHDGFQHHEPAVPNMATETYEVLSDAVDTFQWTKQWYPIAVLEYLDPSRPSTFTLMGNDLVIWKSPGGEWQVFDDVCPHRLAPLSQGRVEPDGTLLCAYHAWRFNDKGECVSIPQCADEEHMKRACSNPRARAHAYPVRYDGGLLWVWGEHGALADAESGMRSPRLLEEIVDLPEDRRWKGPWDLRNLPYGMEMYFENVSDASHVPVSHHKLMGKRSDATWLDVHLERPLTMRDGAKGVMAPRSTSMIDGLNGSYGGVEYMGEPGSHRESFEFLPPCLMVVCVEPGDGSKMMLCLYCVPTTPGFSRSIGCQVIVYDPAGKKPQGPLSLFTLPLPIWITHTLAALFIHQDLVFLHGQERALHRLHERDGRDWLAACYMPAPADKFTAVYRTWLKRAGGVPYAGGLRGTMPPIERDPQKLFSTWNSHTKDCRRCQEGLRALTRAKFGAMGVSAASLVVALMSATATVGAMAAATLMPAQSGAAGAAPAAVQGFLGLDLLTLVSVFGANSGSAAWLSVSFVAAVSAFLLHKYSSLFYVYTFSHQDNE
eukprot:jgi/Mesvir1/25561/Mv01797-RA.1